MENKPLILVYYEYIKEPIHIVEVLNTDDKFIEWLEGGGIPDLEATLKAFEEEELYTHCSMIKDVLDQKKIIKEIDER